MKKLTLNTCILLLITVITIHAQQTDYPQLTGPYLGQKPPGMTPALFCPEIFHMEAHSTAMFSPDGKEVYWNTMDEKQILFMKMEESQWSSPQEVPFSLPEGTGDPALSPDGDKLFFTSFQSVDGEGRSKKENIWYVKRTENSWSDPEPLDSVVNKYSVHWQHSVAANGNLYFSAENSEGNKDIYMSKFVNGEYTEPVGMGNSVNGQDSEGCPYISPDEKYIIFDRHGGNIGFADLYISFRNEDSSWSVAKNMGNVINSLGNETCPFVTFDQKYFFFIRNDQNGTLRIYWVDARIIKALSPAKGKIAYAITPPDGNSELFLINADGTGKTQLTNQLGRSYGPAFSPDTTRIAFYNHLSDQTWSLYMMNADGTNIQRLTYGTDTLDWSPDWSPDGSKLVFARSFSSPIWRSEIWVINPDGSNSYRIGDVDGQGPDWSPDGSKIVYFNYVDGGGDIWTMNAEGTNPIKLTTNPSEDWWPKYSPDGSKIAFQSRRDGNHEIYVMNSDGSNQVRLTNNSTDDEDPNWSPDGTKIAFISMRDGHYEIYTMNADGSNQTRITYTDGHAIDPDWKPAYISPNIQELVAFNSDKSGNDEIYTIDITGNNLKQITSNTYTDYWPSWSNDGKRICHTSIVNGNTDIYMINKEGTDLQRLTYHEAIDREPAVSPDGTRIAFESVRDGNPEIYLMNADGSGTIRLTNNAAVDIYAHWSPNCQKLVFCSNRDGNFEIYSMDSDGSNQIRLTQNSSNDWTPKWSPDGNKILFVSERDGNQEIYLMNSDGSEQKRITDNPGMDIEPDWSCDGSKIVFVSDRNGNHDIYVAELSEDYNLFSCTQITNDPSSERHPVWQPISDTSQIEDSISVNLRSGWNIISLPIDSTYLRSDFIPPPISEAFYYEPDSAKYIVEDTLKSGNGYWLKFFSGGIMRYKMDSTAAETVSVKEGWNMIGSISYLIPVETITSVPPGMITSEFFTYRSGYVGSDTIMPGVGYWIKVNQPGKLILSASEISSSSHCIRITHGDNKPPPPPFDVLSVGEKSIPSRFVLHQNYPNPFNPTTTIRFEIPAQNHVRLEVFNILGSLVNTLLVDEVKAAGSYSITWDGANDDGHQLPTGLYYFRLKSNGLYQIRKVLLIK